MKGLLKALLAIVLCVVLFGVALYLGGYSIDEFLVKIGFKNPSEVFGPYIPNSSSSNITSSIDENNSTAIEDNSDIENSSSTSSSSKTPIQWFPDDNKSNTNSNTNSNNNSSTKDVIVSVGKEVITITKDNVADFIKWLQNNYKDGDNVSVVTPSSSSSSSSINNSSSIIESSTSSVESNSSSSSLVESSSSSSTSENIDEPPIINSEVKYNYTLQSKEDLQVLINSITVVDKLPSYTNYDRASFESPTKSYMLNGEKVNRNDYAWKTSSFFNKDNFTYTCPYTGKVIQDLDDKKEDNDFGNLDFDHIVSLHTVERSCPDWWTDVERNNYAYDQCVGVDVINSANRSKSDKTPSEWLPEINTEDYCYHYLLICSKYELSMAQEDLDICYNIIMTALKNGETVEALNTHVNKWSK